MENGRNGICQRAHQKATVNLVIQLQEMNEKLGRKQAKAQSLEFRLARMRNENSRLRREMKELNEAKSTDEKVREELKVRLLQAEQRLESLTAVFRHSAQQESALARVEERFKERAQETIVLDK